jgi:ubiquinone/menaquinone biosynthesis C-methylase UbiE
MIHKLRAHKSGVTTIISLAEQIPIDSETMDLVYSVDAIHHIQRREDYYNEAYRVLSDGGKVCTVTDSEWVIRHRIPLSTYFPETIEKEIERYPRMVSLKQYMTESGFEDIQEELVSFEYEILSIGGYQEKVYSSLLLIEEEDFQRGIDKMRNDLEKGPIRGVSRYTLLWGTKMSDI